MAIHAAPTRVAIEFAGAGSQALAWLHEVPGSSRTVLEAVDRYACASLVDALGRRPPQFASTEVARSLAILAFTRACELADGQYRVAGLAWSAALATDRSKRGEHRCHVASCDDGAIKTYALELTKGARTRTEEEHLVSRLVLKALADCAGVAAPPPALIDCESIDETLERAPLTERLRAGQFAWVRIGPDGRRSAGARLSNVALLSGSFNPLHDGHRRMAALGARLLGREVQFELPLVNADKSAIDVAEGERRIAQFAGLAPVLVTCLPRYRDKAACFRDSVFIIGADTLARVLEPRFYGGNRAAMLQALDEIRAAGCRFIVAGRLDRRSERFVTLADFEIPEEYRYLFQEIPAERFRVDLSSTELRQGNA